MLKKKYSIDLVGLSMNERKQVSFYLINDMACNYHFSVRSVFLDVCLCCSFYKVFKSIFLFSEKRTIPVFNTFDLTHILVLKIKILCLWHIIIYSQANTLYKFYFCAWFCSNVSYLNYQKRHYLYS